MPTVGEIVKKTTSFFQEKGFDSPRLDSELLISRALGWERLQVFLKFDYPLSESEMEKCRELVRRRAKGEPVAYILGEKGFYENVFEVNTSTLIPRPETELLVERGIEFLNSSHATKPEARQSALVVDLGCGSGCIGLSIAAAVPIIKVLLVDFSQEALEVAKRNAARLGLEARCEFRHADAGDLSALEDLIGRVDLVVANPPYIDPTDERVSPSVRQFEPATALFAGGPGQKGIEEIRRWALTARKLASTSSCTLFEIGDGQGEDAIRIFHEAGWSNVQLRRDLSNRERMIVGLFEGEQHG
jgi:release factor glutamine methyltransferase